MIKVAPLTPAYENEAYSLMMQCIQNAKKRDFHPEQDQDMLNLEKYYSKEDGSLLLIALATENTVEKVVGTLGLKNEGVIDNRKTGMLKRLYVEKPYRLKAVLPLFRSMREHVIAEHFETLRFIARQRMGSIFDTYKGLAENLSMEQETLDEESILYTWKLPPSNGLLSKLFQV